MDVKKWKPTALDMEIAVAEHIGYRQHLIVPNVSWGINLGHEADLLVITKSGYAWEIEIKISKSDLIKDDLKYHGHYSPKVSRLYFAIPVFLEECAPDIQANAGIFLVSENGRVKLLRAPKINNRNKFNDSEKMKVAMLGCMRIFTLKKHLKKVGDKCKKLK
jgi:hypothetical protein